MDMIHVIGRVKMGCGGGMETKRRKGEGEQMEEIEAAPSRNTWRGPGSIQGVHSLGTAGVRGGYSRHPSLVYAVYG